MMSYILSAILSYLLLYKYVAIFAITYLASVLLPLPSDTALLAAGAFAGQGFLNIYLVLFVALAGSVLGDLTGFIVSRLYGREFLLKIGLRKVITSTKFFNLEKFISDNSGSTIFISRFIGQIGPLVNILTGLSKMTFKKFLLYEVLGTLTDVLALGLAGYFLGSAWQNLTEVIEIVGVGLVVIFVAIMFSRVYFRNLNKPRN